MKLYKIYSAGGGAGDWNGVNRVYKTLPQRAKENILLKYGDVFLNHATGRGSGISRIGRLNDVLNLRDWFYQKTDDPEAYQIDILLDTGAAKITSWIQAELENVTSDDLIPEFDRILEETNLIQHYAQVIVASKVNKAISLDIPNPFKMRSANVIRKLNVVNHSDYEEEYIDLCAKYTNILFKELVKLAGEDFALNVLMATLDGSWSPDSLDAYLNKLEFKPKNLAFGGLIGFRGEKFKNNIQKVFEWLGDTSKYDQIHFLGCGGVSNSQIILSIANEVENISADVSTPINRSIDGNKKGTEFSKYYAYQTVNKKIEICESNIDYIINDNVQTSNPLYTEEELKDILDKILKHQSGNSGLETYDARAKLIFHNYDAYQYYCDKNK